MQIYRFILWAQVFMLGLFSSCNNSGKLYHISGKTMGTTYNVKIWSELAVNHNGLQSEIDELLVNVNKSMSTYMKDSEISYFNHQHPLGDWMQVSEDFYYVTKHAVEVANETQGYFDPTIGPLVNLWGFGPDGSRKVPSDLEISAARNKVGFKNLEFNDSERKIRKLVPGLYLDLSASAKGFGVDKVSSFLSSKNFSNFMVEIGGEVKTKGKKGDQNWTIAIESPHPEIEGERIHKVIQLNDLSMATSGDYRNFFIEGGKRYSHEIDFKTGKPITHTMASASVVDAESCMKADSWATAMMVMGPELAQKTAEKLSLPVYLIYKLDQNHENKKFLIYRSPEWNRLFGN